MRRYRKRTSIGPPLNLEKKTILTIIGMAILVFCALLFLSFFTKAGALLSLKDYFFGLFGAGTVLIPFLGVLISLVFFSIKSRLTRINVLFGIHAAYLSALGLVAVSSTKLAGSVGAALWSVLASFFTAPGAFFILLSTLIVSIVITLNTSVGQALAAIVKIQNFTFSILKLLKSKFIRGPRPKITRETASQPTPRAHPQTQETLSPTPLANAPSESQFWEYPPLSLLSGELKTKCSNHRKNAGKLRHYRQSGRGQSWADRYSVRPGNSHGYQALQNFKSAE